MEQNIMDKQKEFLKNTYNEIQSEYYKIIDDLTQFLANEGRANIPEFILTELSIINDWNKGKIDSETTFNKLSKLVIPTVAKNKVIKKIEKYLNVLESYQIRSPYIEYRIKADIKHLNDNVVPKYIKYLKVCNMYFRRLKNIDNEQIKIIHGHTSKKHDKLIWNEMTLNQAIKYIKYNKLNERNDIYSINTYAVSFDSKENLDVIETDWFLAPNTYRCILTKIFDIKLKVLYEEKTWLNIITNDIYESINPIIVK